MSTADFKHGEMVLYVPNHANGDESHPDCEKGVVSSVNDHYVFVKYSKPGCDVWSLTSKATLPDNLVKI